MKIAVLSDTHNMLRPQVMEALQQVDLILHAGDFASQNILDDLRVFAPVKAVQGNNDYTLEDFLPMYLREEIMGRTFVMVHNRNTLPPQLIAGADVIIFGHSHQYVCQRDEDNGQLWLNPGSCGRARFGGGVSFVLLTLEEGQGLEGITVEKVELTDM